MALLASELHFEQGATPLGTTLDLAIWRGLEPGVAAAELAAAPPLAILPFTFERRRASVVIETRGRRRLLCKGAAEEILARCTTVRLDGSQPLAERQVAVEAALGQLLDAGIGCSRSRSGRSSARVAYTEADEVELELLGFLVFADPPKADAARRRSRACSGSASSSRS